LKSSSLISTFSPAGVSVRSLSMACFNAPICPKALSNFCWKAAVWLDARVAQRRELRLVDLHLLRPGCCGRCAAGCAGAALVGSDWARPRVQLPTSFGSLLGSCSASGFGVSVVPVALPRSQLRSPRRALVLFLVGGRIRRCGFSSHGWNFL
jgi:DNA-binding transcriptional LysR family regulator